MHRHYVCRVGLGSTAPMRALRVRIAMVARRMRTGMHQHHVWLARRVSILVAMRHRVRPASLVERIWTAIRARYARRAAWVSTRTLDRWGAVSVVGT